MVSKYESIAKKFLRDEGWMVDWKIRARMPMRGYSVDYFKAFDIMAYKEGQLRFISVKGDMGILKVHRQLIESFKFPQGVVKEIWQYNNIKDVRKVIIE